MGSRQSNLKKEIAALQQDARKKSAKHREDLEIAASEKRRLQLKIDELQASVSRAQEEAEKVKSEAREQEERMKALKWELVRQLRLNGSPTSACFRATLSPSPASRVALNWPDNDDVSPRQSLAPPKRATDDLISVNDSRRSLLETSDADAEETKVTPLNETNAEDAFSRPLKLHYHNAESKDSDVLVLQDDKMSD